jgi:hypothetical protein
LIVSPTATSAPLEAWMIRAQEENEYCEMGKLKMK